MLHTVACIQSGLQKLVTPRPVHAIALSSMCIRTKQSRLLLNITYLMAMEEDVAHVFLQYTRSQEVPPSTWRGGAGRLRVS